MLSRLVPFVCVKWRVFTKQQLILTKLNRPGNLKGLAGFQKNKLNYTYTNVGAKAQPHQPSLLMVSPTRLFKYLRFV